ncbi:putative C6 transcription factor [Teratosphaeria nubilosa]|uniref:Putative C6 transcription factor n=1 Tax=Teratosphaeria nubilosa TaxID=161662 RepID=A0A6G1LAY3_9PEZI|nr:putative C6 transcription factor [Teratosphaeria nubilosa]
MLDFRDSISSRFDLDIPGPENACLSTHDRIDGFVDSKCYQCFSGPGPLTKPPLFILECMMEPYFSNINPHFPIWNREDFQRIVNSFRQHHASTEVGWASIVCCNNLILMTLMADSVHSVRRRWVQPASSENMTPMTLDLIEGFLANARRATENLGLLSPRVINLQALLSLCVVAQQLFPLHLLDFIFAQAVRCAETMGIFQWHRLRNKMTESEISVYKNLAYCLYTMDKRICWTASVSPRILKSQIQLDMALLDDNPKALAAKAELASIEETIFLQIYAGHVTTRTEDEVRAIVEPLIQRLDNWLVRQGVDVEATMRQPQSCPAHAGLFLSSLCAKLLLIWPFRGHPDDCFQQHWSIAVTCVRLLVSLWESRDNDAQHVSIPMYVPQAEQVAHANLYTY